MICKATKIAFLGLMLGLYSCASVQELSRKEFRTLETMVRDNPVFRNIHTGFALYDPIDQTWIYQQDAQKYFTPASNTKLFTLYAFLTVCGDSLPALRYADGPGVRYIQGTGNPLLLHPELPGDERLLQILSQTRAQLIYNTENYADDRLGPGWSWADYQYGYQAEKSPLPVHNNLIVVRGDSTRADFSVAPAFFRSAFAYDPALDRFDQVVIRRVEFGNTFRYNRRAIDGATFTFYRPIFQASRLVPLLLGDTLYRTILTGPLPDTLDLSFRTVYTATPDTLLRKFMQDSDNFLAEQLLLCVSAELFDGHLDSRMVIDSVKNNWLADLPDEPRWVDGSGLSRYNLCTPRSVVRLLEKLRQQFGEQRLLSILPAGGVSGTIQSWYAGPNGEPYVFAKTGTLSNKHALSGYLITESGRTLLFSFMHNNYLGSSRPVKVEMEKVLSFVREAY